MKPSAFLAIALAATQLAGCISVPVLAQIAAGIAGAKATYDTIGLLTAADASLVNAACQEWRITRAAATARIEAGATSAAKAHQAQDSMPWPDAACAPEAPAPADPVQLAVWLIGVTRDIDKLSKG